MPRTRDIIPRRVMSLFWVSVRTSLFWVFSTKPFGLRFLLGLCPGLRAGPGTGMYVYIYIYIYIDVSFPPQPDHTQLLMACAVAGCEAGCEAG